MFSVLGTGKMFGDFLGDPLGHGAINEGVDAQRVSVEQANKLLKDEYDKQSGYLKPWESKGLAALGRMEDPDFQRDFTMNDFQKDPGYDFRMAEGLKAIERSASARGGLQGGATLKALGRYGQDYASNEYKNSYDRFNADRDRRFGRLNSIAGYGSNALNGLVNASQNYGASASGNLIGLGNARAAGNIAKANANQQFMGSLVSLGGKAMSGGAGGGGAPAQGGGTSFGGQSYYNTKGLT